MKHSILVVDDDQLILNTLKNQLATWDTEVYAAGDPASAKEMLDKGRPELVVLDLLLTGDDGSSEVLNYMRSNPAYSHMPVIVLTNLEKPELKDQLLGQGVKEYLIKGKVSLEELNKKIMSYLEPSGEI